MSNLEADAGARAGAAFFPPEFIPLCGCSRRRYRASKAKTRAANDQMLATPLSTTAASRGARRPSKKRSRSSARAEWRALFFRLETFQKVIFKRLRCSAENVAEWLLADRVRGACRAVAALFAPWTRLRAPGPFELPGLQIARGAARVLHRAARAPFRESRLHAPRASSRRRTSVTCAFDQDMRSRARRSFARFSRASSPGRFGALDAATKAPR